MRPLLVEPIAGMPPFVRGVAVIRGVLVPVVDLGALLGTGLSGAVTRFVTLRLDQRQVAVAVDAVLGVQEVDRSRLEEMPPLLGEASAEVVEALGVLDAQFCIWIRAARVLPEEAWQTLSVTEERV
jgi:purine-binding chemotaxis protein CheW